ncbi:MaoC family dehydratase N-terminal domain-containing protein [Mycolicibacterium neoaurum]|uniref:FAS1-like dehydratase domain-containing protein n=1 Tax=Mycolicibacterium neoaurum TaxID=1795 RepID=UPI0026720FB1|nr:MaoC family dehydratase N-terminal domain-containing protein [Mycolicibacterium neoaurum]MDO3402757.1 MaoC family dehydratase N-terminal domain-containing protein [Mycolicibacterium neoaurum]
MTTTGETDKTTEARMPEAVITDEMVASMKARAGVNLRIDHSVNNEEATRIAVIKFAGGIGDVNTLWTDAEQARASDYRAPVAPPSFVIGCFSGIQFGWPGLGAFHNATQAKFHAPVYWGDKITATCRYDGFTGPRPSNFAGRMVTDHFVNSYRNQHDELVAEIDWQVVNFERGSAKSRSKEAAGDKARPELVLPHPWTEDEIVEVEQQVLAEKPRGTEPRYWEDVEVGEALQTLTKGPIGLTDEVAFIAGGGTPIPRLKAHAAALVDYSAHPAWSFRDPVMGSSEPIYAVHYNKAAANAMGVAFQYDVGFQRQCWQIQLLTHWTGDNGWVRSCDSQYRGFVYLSDVVTLGGEVTGKSVTEDGEHVIEVSTFARNQRGANVMPGSATIALPTRDGAASPVARRVKSA